MHMTGSERENEESGLHNTFCIVYRLEVVTTWAKSQGIALWNRKRLMK